MAARGKHTGKGGEDQSGDPISKPFKPSDIKMDTQVINLGFLIEMMENKEINLMPDFQRFGNLWNQKQKSRLIESILLGLPLPSFYFNEEKEEQDGRIMTSWAVIDGQQRLRTLNSFILEQDERKMLRLTNLEYITNYDGKVYADLSREDKRRISGLKVTLNIIQHSTPKDVKYVIFNRVNTAGLELTPQEMRHALNQGIPADFVIELSESQAFLKATDRSISKGRMEDRDYVNRFLAFYLQDYNTDYNGELDYYMNAAMALLVSKTEEERSIIKNTFCKAMNLAFVIFEKAAFRKTKDSSSSRRNPISKAVFDTVSVNLAKLTEQEQEVLLQKKESFKEGMTLLFNTTEFEQSITSGTGKLSSIRTRFERVKSLIQNVIYDKEAAY